MNTLPDKLTQENFERMPALLTRAEFLHWTGLSPADLDDGVAKGAIPFWQRPGEGVRHRKYYKWQAGRFCGFVDAPQRVACGEILHRLRMFGEGMELPRKLAFHEELKRLGTVLSPSWTADHA